MIRYFAGGLSKKIRGEMVRIDGDVMASAHFDPSKDGLFNLDYSRVNLFLDSGAFQRFKSGQRVDAAAALDLQLHRENQLNTTAIALASNDRLIGPKVAAGKESKEDWAAVRQTIDAAEYLASQRRTLGDRICVLGCQGASANQYTVCVREVLRVATEKDWIGLGGWCPLGKNQRWMPVFRETLIEMIPLVAASPVRHIHLYGVLFEPALGNFLWMCDRYGLTCSTDSKKPLSDCRWSTPARRRQAGARRDNYRDNLEWWRTCLANFRDSPYYQSPFSGSVTQRRAKQQVFQLALDLL